jgi:hypothetical protein
MTHSSPSSYPTLARHVGSETLTACVELVCDLHRTMAFHARAPLPVVDFLRLRRRSPGPLATFSGSMNEVMEVKVIEMGYSQ